MNASFRSLSTLSLAAVLIWTTAGCQSETSAPTADANVAAPTISTGATEIPISGFEPAPAPLDPGVKQTAAHDEAASALALPDVKTVKDEVKRTADKLDQNVEQTAENLERKVLDGAHELTDGNIRKAGNVGKETLRKGLKTVEDEFKKEIGGK